MADWLTSDGVEVKLEDDFSRFTDLVLKERKLGAA